MHKSALETGRLFFETYWDQSFHNVLDIGSRDVNGTLRSVKPPQAAYLGVDMTPGAGVELVLKDPHHLPFDDESFDVIVSTSCLEHDPLFWLSVGEMYRVVKPGGFVYINAPSNGIYHGYPFDHWRFYPDAAQALVTWSQKLERPVELVESFIGQKIADVWADNVMVFLRQPCQRRLPEQLICDKLAGVTNVRRHQCYGSTSLEKFVVEPEDLRELKQALAKLEQAQKDGESAKQRETKLIAELKVLQSEVAEIKAPHLNEGLSSNPDHSVATDPSSQLVQVGETNQDVQSSLGEQDCRGNQAQHQVGDTVHSSPAESYQTSFPSGFLKQYQAGTMGYTYKGISCLKSPIDLAIYTKAIWDLKPGTIFELGTNAGGGAVWLADTVEQFALKAKVFSIDLNPPSASLHDRVTFLRGDVNQISQVMQDNDLMHLPRPWLVIEDSAHTYATCLAVLEQMSVLLQPGDLLVIEDGVNDLGLSNQYDGGPNRALKEWFAENPGIFKVDRDLCDMFGKNVTYSPNAWLRRR